MGMMVYSLFWVMQDLYIINRRGLDNYLHYSGDPCYNYSIMGPIKPILVMKTPPPYLFDRGRMRAGTVRRTLRSLSINITVATW